MGKRGAAADRMPEATAQSFRENARFVRDKILGITNQDIADLTGWTLQRVVHTLASGRPVRRANANELQAALRKARPPELRRNDERSHAIDALLGPIEPPSVVPPALIPARAIQEIAGYLVRKMSQPGSGIGPKLRKTITNALETALRASAVEMAQQIYQLNRGGRWIDDGSVATLLRVFGFKVSIDSGPIYEKRSRKR